MNLNRLFQCRGDDLVYIQHLELRILELGSASSSRYPDSLGSQQRISTQCRPCEVCRNPNLYQDLGRSREISTDSIRLASESCDDNQSSQHSRTPERTYTFIPYEPTASSVVKDSSTPTKPTQRKRNHFSLFTSLVSNLPESSDWKNWASINETQRKDIIVSLVSGIAVPKNDRPIASEQLTTIPILLKKYATSMEPVEMKRTSAESVANSPFACFKEFLFCSLCAVALEVMPNEIVFQYMQSVFRCDAQSKALRGRIRGAKWANRAIYLLSRTNWSSCSWDIIYVASNRVNFYSEFNDYSIKPDELIKGLKPEFNPDDTQAISVPLAIPSIIRTIFRDLVPLEKICKCLGYELGDYNKLDLSGLEKLLVVPATNTEPTNTEPTNTEPTYAGSNHTTSNHTTPINKRKNGLLQTPSKRRCQGISSNSPEGDYFETFNESHWSIHATPAPSAPGSCSDSVIYGPFEEFPTSTSSPTQGLLGIDANEEMVGSRIGYSNYSPLTSNHSAQQSILPRSHVDLLFHQGDSIPDPVPLRDARSRTSSAVTISDFESESRADQLSTANLCFGMNGTLDLESNSSSNMATSSTSTTLSQTFSRKDITQQQGSKSRLCNVQVDTVHTDSEDSYSRMGCEPHEYMNEHVSQTRLSPLSTDWSQQYGWEFDGILQQGLSANDPQLPPWTDLSEQYGWEFDGILQQGLSANDPQLPLWTDLSEQYGWEFDGILQQGLSVNDPQLPPWTDWSQQYGWGFDSILQQGLSANDPQLPPWTEWSQQYGWEFDGILQQGLSANDPQLPPSTDRSQQCSFDLLQQDLSLSSHSPLPSLGLGQEGGIAISGNSPETRYHLLFRPSLMPREGSSSWDLGNSRHALGFSDAIQRNASYSPDRSLLVI